jgi:hypothetical protein
MFFAFEASVFGIATVKTPLLYVAEILSASQLGAKV